MTTGLFSKYYGPFTGSDWLRNAPAECRKMFSEQGLRAIRDAEVELQSLGGKARAKAADRCPNGHMMCKTCKVCKACERKALKASHYAKHYESADPAPEPPEETTQDDNNGNDGFVWSTLLGGFVRSDILLTEEVPF